MNYSADVQKFDPTSRHDTYNGRSVRPTIYPIGIRKYLAVMADRDPRWPEPIESWHGLTLKGEDALERGTGHLVNREVSVVTDVDTAIWSYRQSRRRHIGSAIEHRGLPNEAYDSI
jgi:hypothetical protein